MQSGRSSIRSSLDFPRSSSGLWPATLAVGRCPSCATDRAVLPARAPHGEH